MGNVLLGDDGFGPLAVEMFRCDYDCGPRVEIVDVGTPGLDLAPYLFEKDLVVLIDAVLTDRPPGHLTVYGEADFTSTLDRHEVQLRITGHDPGLWETLAHMRLADCGPAEVIVIGVVPKSMNFGDPMNSEVTEVLSNAMSLVSQLLAQRGVVCHRRVPSLKSCLWWTSGQEARLA